jgi:hypothetical protein
MVETRKFFDYDEVKWFLSAYKDQMEVLENKTLKTCYKLKIKWF